jgi:hypothetical protein
MSEKLIEKMKAGGFSREKLENLYANARRLGMTDILVAAKQALKEIDSRFYSRQFIKPIKDKVQRIMNEIAEDNSWANWEDNKVSNGVKSGSATPKGKELAEFYISYRNPAWEKAAYLSVFQHDEESSVNYKVGLHDGEQVIVETRQEAVALFGEDIRAG